MQDQSDQGPQSPLQAPDAQGLYDPQHERAACGVGFVVHLKGQRSHAIVEKGLELLRNLEHRGACGCEVNTGDGAGILVQMPDQLPAQGHRPARHHAARKPAPTAPASCSCRTTPAQRAAIVARFEAIIRDEGQIVLGWRDVPTDDTHRRRDRPPRRARVQAGLHRPRRSDLSEPPTRSSSSASSTSSASASSTRSTRSTSSERKLFYIVSLSSRTMIWKGMLTAGQLGAMFLDLATPTSSRASRSSTSASAPTRSRRGRSRIPIA